MHSTIPKTTLLVSLFYLISIYHAYAQLINWGKLQTSKSQLYTPHIMGEDDNYFYSTSTIIPDIYIEKFKKSDLSRQYSKLVPHPKIGSTELEYEGIYFMQNRFVIFASYFNSKENNTNVYAYIYNADDGAKAGEPKLIMTVPVEKLKRKGSFYVFVSSDRSKILVNHAGYYKKEKCIKDKYLLLNADLEIITEKEDKIFKDEIDFRTFNFAIDNDGSVYYIKTMTSGESFIVSYDASKDYEKWEEHIDFSDLDRKTKVYNINFKLNVEGDMMLVGFFTLDNKNVEGTFVMKIRTSSKEIVYKKTNAFDKEALKKLRIVNASYSNTKTPKIPVEIYNSTEIVTKEDGGIILIGENQFIYTNGLYEIGSIVIFNHSKDGDLVWTQKIPKDQHYAIKAMFKPIEVARKSSEYISYFPAIQNEKLNIYINDNSKNIGTSQQAMLNSNKAMLCNLLRMKKTMPVCFRINLETGEVQKSEMLPKQKEKVYFKPTLSYQTNNSGDVIFFSQAKYNYKFGILTE
jgi:hypothetical protein